MVTSVQCNRSDNIFRKIDALSYFTIQGQIQRKRRFERLKCVPRICASSGKDMSTTVLSAMAKDVKGIIRCDCPSRELVLV